GDEPRPIERVSEWFDLVLHPNLPASGGCPAAGLQTKCGLGVGEAQHVDGCRIIGSDLAGKTIQAVAAVPVVEERPSFFELSIVEAKRTEEQVREAVAIDIPRGRG